jgi:hypothetical protein
MSTAPVPPPGYYPDPQTGQGRYWNGAAWSDFAPPAAPIDYGLGAPMAPAPTAQQVGVTGFGIAALVLGLLWMYGVGSILAIIFGVLGRKQCDRGERNGRGLATAGLVLGIVGLSVIALVVLVAASDPGAFEGGGTI